MNSFDLHKSFMFVLIIDSLETKIRVTKTKHLVSSIDKPVSEITVLHYLDGSRITNLKPLGKWTRMVPRTPDFATLRTTKVSEETKDPSGNSPRSDALSGWSRGRAGRRKGPSWTDGV